MIDAIRGTKQGCPKSGTLWVVAFDPVIRFLGFVVQRIPASRTECADDIAIAIAQVGRRHLRVLDVAGPGVGIVVNARKTQAVACFAHVADEVAAELRAADARLVARHLGVPVGPLAAQGALGWDGDSRAVVERGRRLKSTGRSPVEVMLYQPYVAPVPGYRPQFPPPDSRLRTAEEVALAIVSALPMRAIPAQE